MGRVGRHGAPGEARSRPAATTPSRSTPGRLLADLRGADPLPPSRGYAAAGRAAGGAHRGTQHRAGAHLEPRAQSPAALPRDARGADRDRQDPGEPGASIRSDPPSGGGGRIRLGRCGSPGRRLSRGCAAAGLAPPRPPSPRYDWQMKSRSGLCCATSGRPTRGCWRSTRRSGSPTTVSSTVASWSSSDQAGGRSGGIDPLQPRPHPPFAHQRRTGSSALKLARLNAAMALTPAARGRRAGRRERSVAGTLDDEARDAPLPGQDALEDRALAHRPALAAARAQYEASEQTLRAETAARWPWLVLSAIPRVRQNEAITATHRRRRGRRRDPSRLRHQRGTGAVGDGGARGGAGAMTSASRRRAR